MQNQSRRGMFKTRVFIGFLVIMLTTPSLSLGWGAGGHMMVASIALRRLNPRARAKATALLARQITPPALSVQSRDFVNAAHWADDLRPFTEFDSFKPRHFIDQPFSTDGTTLPAGIPEADNIVKALEDNVNILKTSADKDAQAQALRFIIHFVGDIHQPLHCATQVSRANPEGDRGGNLVNISIPGSGGELRQTNLHSYWDGGIGSFPRTGPNFTPPPLNQIGPATLIAMRGNPASDPNLKLKSPFNYSAWAKESFVLAQEVAYRGVTNGSTPDARYNAASLRVVRKRVAWGGYRLAALLNSIWP